MSHLKDESSRIAAYRLAWEIVQAAGVTNSLISSDLGRKETAKQTANLVIQIQQALIENEVIESEK